MRESGKYGNYILLTVERPSRGHRRIGVESPGNAEVDAGRKQPRPRAPLDSEKSMRSEIKYQSEIGCRRRPFDSGSTVVVMRD